MKTNDNFQSSTFDSQLIRVAIADDHTLVAKSLSKLIDDSKIAQVMNTYYTLESCRVGLSKSIPDVLLLDIAMTDGDGVDFCAEMTKIYPELNVIMLTSYKEINVAKRALRSGALGYVLKNAEPEEILAGIKTVSDGERFLCEEINLLLKRKLIEEPVWYSKREKDVLQFTADGYTSKECADKMYLSEDTIKSYRKNLLIKLEAKNTSEMIKKGYEQHLIL